jgi:hypothetical protein
VNDAGDLTDPRLMYAKGALFLIAGGLAAAALLAEARSVPVAVLLAVTVWCFSRAYYFAFYVVGRYVDPSYRFAGLGSFVRYLLRGRRPPPPYPPDRRSL